MAINIALIRNAQAYDFGGGERFPVLLASILKKQGFNPVLISRSESLSLFAHDNKIKTIRGWWWSKQNWSGPMVLFMPLYLTWQFILFIYYVLQFIKIKPKLVHIQSKDDFIAGTYAAKLLGIKVIWTDHADLKHIWKNITVWYKNPVGKMVYLAAKHSQAITVVSKSEKKLVMLNIPQKSLLNQKIKVIYNGAFDHYKSTSSREKDIYIAVSRLVIDKGISELINAYGRIENDHNELWLIGDGNDRSIFKEQAQKHKGITFLGQQLDPTPYLEKAAYFVHPTHHEGFSLSVVEASMMQLPIIATAVGGNPEIVINNETGILVSPKNVEELASAMKKLASDRKQSTKLGVNARKQFLDKFEFNAIVKNDFIPLYKEILR